MFSVCFSAQVNFKSFLLAQVSLLHQDFQDSFSLPESLLTSEHLFNHFNHSGTNESFPDSLIIHMVSHFFMTERVHSNILHSNHCLLYLTYPTSLLALSDKPSYFLLVYPPCLPLFLPSLPGSLSPLFHASDLPTSHTSPCCIHLKNLPGLTLGSAFNTYNMVVPSYS